MTRRAELTELITQLVAINSANPSTCVHGDGEARIAAHCTEWLCARGINARLVLPDPHVPRPAVLAKVGAAGGGRTLLLVGHLDTHSWYAPPQTTRPGTICGPGASDMKGGLAVIMCALECVAHSLRRGQIRAIFSPDEEHASFGLRALAPSVEADAAVVAENTSLKLGVRHAGRVRAWIEPRGRAERRELLLRLCAISDQIDGAGLMHTAWNRATSAIVVDRQVTPGEDAWSIHDHLSREIAALTRAKLTWDVREAFLAVPDDPIQRRIAARAVSCGVEAHTVSVAGWTEAGVLAAHGIPSVVFGPGGSGAHSGDEWLDADQAEQAVEILSAAAVDYCT